MSKKEEKAREYALNMYRTDLGYDKFDIQDSYEAGWDEALKSILVDASKELPEYDESVWAINENGDKFFCHRSNEGIVQTDKYGWCNYSGCDIIAWIRPISFDEILRLNKDVLKRLKNK